VKTFLFLNTVLRSSMDRHRGESTELKNVNRSVNGVASL